MARNMSSPPKRGGTASKTRRRTSTSARSTKSSRTASAGRKRRRATLRTYIMLAVILVIFIGLGAFISSKLMGSPKTTKDMATVSRQQELTHKVKLPDDFQSLVAKGNKEFDRRRYPEARQWYSKALAINPKAVSVLVDLGTCYFYSGAPRKALVMYDRALETDPDNRSALYNKGMVMSENGDYEGARCSWQEYLATHPSDAETLEVKELMAKLGAD